MIQPNGDTVTVILRGDEYGSWHENINGQIIVLNDAGFWTYAQARNGMIVASDVIVSDKVSYQMEQKDNAAVRKIIFSRQETNQIPVNNARI